MKTHTACPVIKTGVVTMLTFALLAVLAQPVGLALAGPPPPAPPTVWINMNDLVLSPGSTGVTEITVGNVNSLYGIDFKLKWPVGCLRVAGTKVELGPVFPAGSSFVAQNVVDNTAGEVHFGVSLSPPAAAFHGTGVVARITWEATCAVNTQISFAPNSVIMSTREGTPVTPMPYWIGWSTVTTATVMPITGQVLLQGRANHSGTSVFASEQSCPAVDLTAINVSSLPYVYALTNAAGNFVLNLDTHRTYRCITAFKQNYLVGQKDMPVGNLGSITLLGGDVNQDNCINIFDLTMIGSRYGSTDSRGDVNGDLTVNIYDLTIAAGNFGRCRPIIW